MNTKQIKQIAQFLSAYSKDVAEAGIEAWRTGEMTAVTSGTGIQGMAADVPLAQKYNELTDEAKQFIKEESEKMQKIMPFCKCGQQLNLMGVCGGCPQGKDGFKTKFICANKECGYEEYFKETLQEKINELKGVLK